eukprot:TRINITY_DN54980_c0_g1_i1.p1 TRINITY_DN54980_c0_g1~~TRINITY_DN54980_c0_g1_i1.p1  ORF type:complete len:544 (-),score=80.19 TRINITY_DN54980_c0_g1_i1:107-1738(-)
MSARDVEMSPLLLKEGQMAMSNAFDDETLVATAPMSKLRGSGRASVTEGFAATVRDGNIRCGSVKTAQVLQQRRPDHGSSWRCPTGVMRRASLYRPPVLPVVASNVISERTVCLEKYLDDTRDWRRLNSADVAAVFTDLSTQLLPPKTPRLYTTPFRRDPEAVPQYEGLLSAVAIGTLQACSEGSFWAPWHNAPEATEVKVIRTPMSRLFTKAPDVDTTSAVDASEESSPMPRPGSASASSAGQQLTVCRDVSPLATCIELAGEGCGHLRLALVRFIAAGDARAAVEPSLTLTDHRESQLLLQTSFLPALRQMERHIHRDPCQALQAGGIIYTTDVTVLRGPMQSGAPWLGNAPQIDVISAALQRSPRCDDQGQYARITEKATAMETLDLIFACASAHAVDVLVFPPPGVGGVAGCSHPAADAGDLLRKAVLAHATRVPRVFVCQEFPDQIPLSTWQTFAAALERGREPLEHPGLVPIAASPYVRPGWERKLKPHKYVYPQWLLSGDRDVLVGGASSAASFATPRQSKGGGRPLGGAGRAIVC